MARKNEGEFMGHILVTGGAGYIGSHTVRYLAEKGHRIIVVDNLVYGHRDALPSEQVDLIVGDIGDKQLMTEVFKRYDIQAVLHFAAYAYVGESVTDPARYYANNLVAPLNMLEVMREFNCKRIIFSSTCATYGHPQYLPIDEKHPQRPINPYGKSKLMLEEIIKDYYTAYAFRYAFLRYFNACGASHDGAIGEDHNPETHLIPLILDAASGEREAITIYGTDYDTEDGTCVRDYIHVEDLASAHGAALDRLLGDGDSLMVNLGTGQGHSIKEVIDAAKAVTGREFDVRLGQRRPGDPAVLVANPEMAKKALDWEAEVRDIEDIIRSAWNWKTGPKGGKYSK